MCQTESLTRKQKQTVKQCWLVKPTEPLSHWNFQSPRLSGVMNLFELKTKELSQLNFLNQSTKLKYLFLLEEYESPTSIRCLFDMFLFLQMAMEQLYHILRCPSLIKIIDQSECKIRKHKKYRERVNVRSRGLLSDNKRYTLHVNMGDEAGQETFLEFHEMGLDDRIQKVLIWKTDYFSTCCIII